MHGQDPTDLPQSLFGIDQFLHLYHLGLALHDHIEAGQPGIEDAPFHIARDFLGPDPHPLQFGVIDVQAVGTAADSKMEASLPENGNGGLLEAPFR